MKKLLLSLIPVLITASSFSQIAKDYSVGTNLDLIRSDNDGYFEKAQASVEVNYFLFRKLTATAGAEYWTRNQQASLVMGGRWFPVKEAFLRLRGLIGSNDIALGGGWSKPLKPESNWYFESMADVYIIHGYVTIRAGVVYVVKRK
jgi:hypothetical protein